MSELLDRHRRVMGLDAPLFYSEPLQLVRGDGVWLHDERGGRYLDVYNNVPCVGHANPHVVDAMASQAATLNVHSRYLHEGVVNYAERLTDLMADGLDSVVITCTGSEANEVAIMMAREATGGHGLICTNGTYHGNTDQVAKLTHLPVGQARSGIRSIAVPERFRPAAPDLSESELCQWHLDQLAGTIEACQSDGGFAGLILCSILANEGLPDIPDQFLPQAAAMVRKAGGVLIADEVQAGFARSGSWWGYQTNGFQPDIATVGKPMGNGLPMAGTIASNDIVTGFRRRHRYFNTFACSPLQAAVGNAVIDEIEDRGLIDQVAAVGSGLKSTLSKMASNHPAMGDVRGIGLFIGIDWVKPGTTEPDVEGATLVVEAMKDRGVLMGQAGQHRNVLKIRPPLVFDEDHATLFIERFGDALAHIES